MKKILSLIALCLLTLSIKAQEQKDYPLYANGVVEFGYLIPEDVYYIIYRDTINFPDFTLYEDEEYLEETYINIECNRDDFFEYLFWFAEEQVKKTDLFYNSDSKFIIREIITPVEGGDNHRFYLINKTTCTH